MKRLDKMNKRDLIDLNKTIMKEVPTDLISSFNYFRRETLSELGEENQFKMNMQTRKQHLLNGTKASICAVNLIGESKILEKLL